jgi:hypothetical protein
MKAHDDIAGNTTWVNLSAERSEKLGRAGLQIPRHCASTSAKKKESKAGSARSCDLAGRGGRFDKLSTSFQGEVQFY